MLNKFGFNLDEPSNKDLVFGTSLPYIELQSDGNWESFLPDREFQNLNGVEPYACVTYTVLNAIETLIKRKYGISKNYSDRFLASISGTREGGNSPRTVCDALRKNGVPLQDIWPFNQNVDTFQKYYEEIPEEVKEIAKEFLNEWDFKYEVVPSTNTMISLALKTSPLLISVSAWFEKDGIYYRPEGMIDNHATTLFVQSEGRYRRVFDSYDQPCIKDVDWNAMPMQIVRFHIEKLETPPSKPYWFVELFNSLWSFIRDILTK